MSDQETVRRPDPARPYVALSNRHRWGRCALSAVLPQVRTPSRPEAAEGTEAHKAAEWAVHQRFQVGAPAPAPELLPPPDIPSLDYSPAGVVAWQTQVLGYAQNYAAGAASLFSDLRGTPTIAMTELQLDTQTIEGVAVGGIADSVFWNASAGRLVVGDYKFGRSPVGVGTASDPNEQCAGAAVLWSLQTSGVDVRQVGLFVYQPRIRTGAGEPWQALAPLGPDWLQAEDLKLRQELRAIKHAADELAAGRLIDGTPGDHCKYCPSARWCPAAAGFAALALDVDSNVRAVVDMTPEEVMAAWGARSAFKAFEDDLRERVKILHEQHHPAVATSRRRGARTWQHPQQVVEQLMLADRYDLLQPPSLEKATEALGSGAVDALTVQLPDVITYKPAGGKDAALARAAFAKYLPTNNSES